MNNTPNDYVFVFTEPIDNTDVQFKELESLLILSSFQLMDVYDISLNRFISNPPDVSPNNNIVYRVKFKQSCILRTLAPIDLLHEIIKRSAYVDSCGPYVYSSKMDKSSITSIRSAMTKFITSNEISSFELSFFTHEKFSDKAGKKSRLLIDEKRFFLGDLPFDQVQKHFED